MTLKDADKTANNKDPDQTAPLREVWSGAALFPNTVYSNVSDHYGTGMIQSFQTESLYMYPDQSAPIECCMFGILSNFLLNQCSNAKPPCLNFRVFPQILRLFET